MNKLFYLIYNSYYKNGNYKNDKTILTVGGIFTFFYASLALASAFLIDRIYPTFNFEGNHKIEAFILVILSGSFTFYRFLYKNKYELIYNEHKNNAVLNSLPAKFLGFVIVILVISSPITFSFLANKLINGRWY